MNLIVLHLGMTMDDFSKCSTDEKKQSQSTSDLKVTLKDKLLRFYRIQIGHFPKMVYQSAYHKKVAFRKYKL